MQVTQVRYVFAIEETLKTAKPGKHLEPIELEAYGDDVNLCIVAHLRQYLIKTGPVRGNSSNLLISYIKPHQPVGSSTV